MLLIERVARLELLLAGICTLLQADDRADLSHFLVNQYQYGSCGDGTLDACARWQRNDMVADCQFFLDYGKFKEGRLLNE